MAFFDEIREPELRGVFEFWLEKRGGRAVPLRSEISPTGLKPGYLPNLFMYRRESDGRLRCILVGTELVNVFHRDETGKYLDEIIPSYASNSRLKLFTRCVDEARPVYYTGPALIPSGERRRVARLLLPLSSDGDATDHIFGMALFGPLLNGLPTSVRLPGSDEPAVIAVAAEDDL